MSVTHIIKSYPNEVVRVKNDYKIWLFKETDSYFWNSESKLKWLMSLYKQSLSDWYFRPGPITGSINWNHIQRVGLYLNDVAGSSLRVCINTQQYI